MNDNKIQKIIKELEEDKNKIKSFIQNDSLSIGDKIQIAMQLNFDIDMNQLLEQY